ncbi:hypothetical protein Nisw_00380 [Candidatus Nitrosopumilus sp. SW]|uniref:hypothetical protein n=1 Tax=Candidatus Nitrosopumilus sp. SW TaxID=2508726 RepID=UPI0011511C97|nr:hypothetical protein [Candidatus Nitrosopumilus sp. SW]QDI88093.1 hypothetical protein Nisw_00380 [Candidatus Nitrosopumilus sp. SW]
MDILIGIVIAFIIVVAAYVGYYASQQESEVGEHDISLELEVLDLDSKNIQPLKQIITKSIS